MRYYSLRQDLFIYEQTASLSLVKEIEKLGFKYQSGQMGGGGEAAIKEIVIAWLTMKELWIGVFSSLLANQIQKILGSLYNWHTSNSNKIKNKKYIPEVCIFIYPHVLSKASYVAFFRIDKKHSKKDIIEEIKKAQDKTV